MESPRYARWVPSPALLAAVAFATVMLLLSLVLHRPDLLVFAVPFIAVGTWMMATRPAQAPVIAHQISTTSPTEGRTSRWTVTAAAMGGAEQWYAVLEPTPRIEWEHPIAGAAVNDLEAALSVGWTPRRTGPARLGGAHLLITSPWAGFRWGPIHLSPFDIRALPRTEPFSGRTDLPHPVGLVGQNRSRRSGSGTEFADIRQFIAGDRLRTIHWPVTARTGQLHVRTSFAEQDTEVLILLDASIDFGAPEHGTSLDRGLRAASAISEFFLRRGERVGLRVIGSARVLRVPPSLGLRQHQRILDVLSTVEVGRFGDREPSRVRLNVAAGALVVMVSPMLGRFPTTVAATLASRGVSVVVVDVLPQPVVLQYDEPAARTALRIRLLERAVEIDDLGTHGVPVATWVGPGSLDQVVRQLARRPPARMRTR